MSLSAAVTTRRRSATTGDTLADGGAGPLVGRPTNPIDSLMQAVDESLREMDLPGFETQTLVWLDGRVDTSCLRRAIVRLSGRYPIVTGRLITERRGRPVWRRRPGAEASLLEADLTSADCTAVLDEAARLLSAPHDLAASDPIQFRLLHLPNGRDVFIMQYSHVLMDNIAAVPVIRELGRLSDPDAAEPEEAAGESHDAMSEYLRRFPLGRRLRAAGRLADLRVRTLRFRPVILGGVANVAGQSRFRILSRTIESNSTRALLEKIVEVCRWPGVSMTILGSVFRSLAQFAPPQQARRNYIAGIGVDLGLRGPEGPLFQNLVSFFPISARSDELSDGKVLMRNLNCQLRERIQQEFDLGVVELARLARPFPRAFRRTTGRLLRNNYSLWYAYFGSLDAAGERFFGANIAAVRCVGPCWPPAGLTLLVNQFRGRIYLQATYLPEILPDSLANEFLDAVVHDLIGFVEGR